MPTSNNGTYYYSGNYTSGLAINNPKAVINSTATIGGSGIDDTGEGGGSLAILGVVTAYSEAVGLAENMTVAVLAGHVTGVGLGFGGLGGDTIVNTYGTIAATDSTGFAIDIQAGTGQINEASLSNRGLIEATGTNATAVYFGGAAYVKNAHKGGIILGGAFGVELFEGGTIINTGSAVISAAGFAVDMVGYGFVENDAASRIGSYGTTEIGIRLEGGGTVTNAGLVYGTTGGVDLTGGELDNSGLIKAAGHGVYDGAGDVTNALGGTISGGTYGVIISGVPVYPSVLTNLGVIEAGPTIQPIFSEGAGVRFAAGEAISNSGTIADQGGGAGVWGGVGAPGTVTGPSVDNKGLIEGLGTKHATFGVYLAGGSLLNEATGTITSQSFVVEARYGGTIVNHGKILGFGGFTYGSIGIVANGGVTITNDGQIITSGTLGEAANITGGSLTNSGTMVGAGGIEVAGGCVVVNSGTIAANGTQGIGLRIQAPFGTYHNPVDVSNSGLIESTGSGGRGAYLLDGILTNTGRVIGQSLGIDASSSTLVSSGTIQATPIYGGIGVNMNDGYIDNLAHGLILGTGEGVDIFRGTLINHGLIDASGTAGAQNYGPAIGVQANYAAQVTNAFDGTIEGQVAVEAWGTTNYWAHAVTFQNFGTIESSAGATGMAFEFLSAGGTLVAGTGSKFIGSVYGHGGTLELASGSGTIDQVSAFAKVTFANSATWTFDGDSTITGGLTLGSTDTVIAAGTIDGGGGATGTSVKLGATNDRLIVETGAGFVGALIGGGGTLEFAAGSAGSLSGFAASGFATIMIDAKANWGLIGNITLGGGQHLDNAGTLDLEGTVAGTGTITNEGVLEKLNPGINSVIAGTFTDTGSISLTGGMLGFTGPADTFSGAITGTGTLAFGGGADALNAGTTIGVNAWSITSGVVSLNESLGFAGALSLTGGRITIASGDKLSLSGLNNALSATVNGAGTLAITGGSDTINAGGAIQAAAWSIAGTGTMVTLNESLSFAGSFTDKAGITVSTGDKLILTGPSSFANATINGAGIVYNSGGATVGALLLGAGAQLQNAAQLTLAGGSLTVGDTVGTAGATLDNLSGGTITLSDNGGILSGVSTGDRLVNAGTLAKTGSGTLSTIAVSVADTGMITIASGAVLAFSGQNNSFTGGIEGTGGTLAFTGGSDTIHSGTGISTSNWAITGAAKVTLAETLVYNGALNFSSGTLILGANTLQFGSAVVTVAGAITGSPGSALVQNGGTDTFNVGATVATTSWSQTGGTLAINANLAYGGSFTQSAGTMNITGVFLATAGTDAFTGKIAGTGLLKLAGGTDTFNAGASVSVAAWTVSGGSTLVTLAESLSYAGTFASGTDTLALGSGDKLILSNAASFAGTTVNGSGILYLGGATSVTGLSISGTVELENVGTATQHGNNLILGKIAGDAVSFYNTKTGIWNLTDDFGIGTAVAGATINNQGLLEKTGVTVGGTGISKINPAITNTGTIAVTAGTLELHGAVGGTGAETIGAAGTLQVDASVAATQTVTFAAATGELILNDPSGTHLAFAGTIAGFGGTDQIDLSTFAYNTNTSLVWSQTAGTLTVTDGTKSAVLHLTGTYTSASFSQSNVGGFTVISDPPPAQVARAARADTVGSTGGSAPPKAIAAGALADRLAGFAGTGRPALASHDSLLAGFHAGNGPSVPAWTPVHPVPLGAAATPLQVMHGDLAAPGGWAGHGAIG